MDYTRFSHLHNHICLFNINFSTENNIVDHQRLTIVGSDNLNIVHELGREKKHLQPVKPGATYTATMQGYDFIGKEIAAGRIEFRARLLFV